MTKGIECLLTAMNHDFFFAGASKVEKPEYEFNITNENPRYAIRGFIDRLAFYEKIAIVRDYKSSKKRYSNKELPDNLQALMYQLAVAKLFKIKSKVQFLFLKFGKKAEQTVPPLGKDYLKGAEYYLADITRKLENFTENDAKSDFAATDPNRKWLCGKLEEGKFCCPYRKAVKYYGIMNSDGKIVKTSLVKKELKPRDNEIIVSLESSPCPYYDNSL